LSLIYLIQNTENFYKIGYTNRTTRKRLEELQTANAGDLKIVHEVDVVNATAVETTLHNLHSSSRLNGEWFSLEEKEVANFVKECKRIDEAISFVKKNSTFYT